MFDFSLKPISLHESAEKLLVFQLNFSGDVARHEKLHQNKNQVENQLAGTLACVLWKVTLLSIII